MQQAMIAVLGAGPSGLMAAWAAEQAGHDVYLFDVRPRAPDGRSAGVFYLHDACGLDVPHTTLITSGSGSADDYRRKVYGADYKGHVSFPSQSRFDVVWDGMAAMDQLWLRYLPRILPLRVKDYAEAVEYTIMYERVISTIPLDVLLPQATLPSEQVYISTRSKGIGGEETCSAVRYFAEPDIPYYRVSCLFGRQAIEWAPGQAPAPDENGWVTHIARKVRQLPAPLKLPAHRNFLLTGRYGAWDKTCLTHNVYERVREWLDA